LVQRTVINA